MKENEDIISSIDTYFGTFEKLCNIHTDFFNEIIYPELFTIDANTLKNRLVVSLLDNSNSAIYLQRYITQKYDDIKAILKKEWHDISLITNIDSYIRDAKVEVKCKLLSSMFPQKITYDGKSYRTNSYNSVLDLIYQQTNELRGNEKGQTHKNTNLSYFVPRAGVEPAWK